MRGAGGNRVQMSVFVFQAEDGIRDATVTGVQTCALPISSKFAPQPEQGERLRRPAMAVLPTGTVTFLFTDIEGSTRLWEEHAEAMRAALGRHDDLLRAAITEHRGHVFKTVGDAFHAAFPTAADALAAALDAPWPASPGRCPAVCGCGWPCTPARPTSAMGTTLALR